MSTWKRLSPYASSLGVHAVLALLLAMWVLPAMQRGADVLEIQSALSATHPDDIAQLSDVSFDLQTAVVSTAVVVAESVPQGSVTQQSIPTVPLSAASVTDTVRPVRTVVPRLPSAEDLSDEELMVEVPKIMAAMPMHQHRGVTRVAEAAGTAQIVGQLSGDLASIARDGDAVVVWLMDQSVSMQRDRAAMAAQLLQRLQTIQEDKTSRMMHYVVAFGDSVRVVQNSTTKAHATANAIASMSVDPSGVENTFQAVEWCLDNLFGNPLWLKGGEKQKLLVIWTDESGDDCLRLENTIQRCLRANVRVDIIGPSAVLGAQTGYSAYQHPPDGKVYYLPVHRGPDSSFPQKLSLGYWHRDVPVSHDESVQGPWQGDAQGFGGSNLDALLSGFSPYALTRLARQTGGRYTIYDRPGDRSPFRVENLDGYQPDYRSLQEIMADLQSQPLRQVVLAASEVTWKSPFTRESEPPLQAITMHRWMTSNEFRDHLRARLPFVLARANKTAAVVEQAINFYVMADRMPAYTPQMQDPSDAFGSRANSLNSRMGRRDTKDEDPAESQSGNSTERPAEPEAPEGLTEINETRLEQLYREEPSKRWRAWCDLNLGRLLAVSVRLRESILVLSSLEHPNGLDSRTNRISFSVSDVPTGDPVSIQRAELAVRLLQRCIADHPETPWAVMAERELRYGFGTRMQQQSVPRPPPAPVSPTPTPRPSAPQLPRL
ncbi:MAG: vWA domain-containing protein [Planctomycetaceae bacterium]